MAKQLINGAVGEEVSALKADLIKLGYKLSDKGANKGVFGTKTEAVIKDFQQKAHLQETGWVDVVTRAAIKNAISNKETPEAVKAKKVLAPAPTPEGGTMPFWVSHLVSRLGWTEFSHTKQIAKDWPYCGLNYTTVIGVKHAWCGLACEIALRSGGLKGPRGSAGARNWSGFGESCGYICGAFLPIQHKSGGRHITVFLYWIDEKKKIAACIGGNQNDRYQISAYNLSGNKAGHEEVVGGPRWPKGYPKTNFIYPRGNATVGGSTR